jgi:hypothetical protein
MAPIGARETERVTNRLARLMDFIALCVARKDMTEQTARFARKAWELMVMNAPDGMAVPDASAGPDDTFLFTWDDGVHHLELEMEKDRTLSCFYRNRETQAIWGEDVIDGVLPCQMVEYLKLFSAPQIG